MQVYLVNLDRSATRLGKMGRALAGRGVAYERVAAVDGSTLPESIVSANPSLSRGETGCLLSHRAVWKLIADRDEPFGLVLEDDVHLSAQFSAFAVREDWIPGDADIVKLETTRKPVIVDSSGIDAPAGRQTVRLRSPHLCSAGYIISRRMAARLLAATQSLPVDVLLFDPPWGTKEERTIYQIVPALCIQRRGESDIREGRKEYHRQLSNIVPFQVTKISRYLRQRIALARTFLTAQRGSLVRKPIPFAAN